MMKFSVRPAQLEDLNTLVTFTRMEALHAEGIELNPEMMRKGVKAALDDSTIARYWVLENDDGEIIGSVSVVKEWSNWNAGFYWWVQSMFIAPEYRAQKLMSHLIETVRETAKKENALDIRLLVHQDNRRAQKAYRREGFSNAPYEIMILGLE
jgi:GNAT superfamily N-acetyltransferase